MTYKLQPLIGRRTFVPKTPFKKKKKILTRSDMLFCSQTFCRCFIFSSCPQICIGTKITAYFCHRKHASDVEKITFGEICKQECEFNQVQKQKKPHNLTPAIFCAPHQILPPTFWLSPGRLLVCWANSPDTPLGPFSELPFRSASPRAIR